MATPTNYFIKILSLSLYHCVKFGGERQNIKYLYILAIKTTVNCPGNHLNNGHIGTCKTGPSNEVASILRYKCTEKAKLGSYKGGLYTEVAFLLSDH